MSYKILQLRRDTAANWTSNNPILSVGEVGVETDTYKMKIGDGTTAWNSRGYFGGTDGDAIHDNVAGEIAAITEKATPASADVLLIEDSADSNNKKKVQIGNLPAGGWVGTPSYCKVSLANAQGIPSGETYTKILFDTVDYDALGEWNATNKQFVASVAGYYHITSCVGIGATAAMSAVRLGLMKNNSRIACVLQRPSTGWVNSLVSMDVYLDIGDTIHADISHWAATTQGTYHVEGNPFLDIHRIV